MKIIIGKIEFTLLGEARFIYDAKSDSLIITKTEIINNYVENIEPEIKRGRPNTKDGMTNKIIDLLRDAKDPVGKQMITLHCLGKNAESKKIKFLGHLLDQMTEEGKLICTSPNNRRMYELPGKQTQLTTLHG